MISPSEHRTECTFDVQYIMDGYHVSHDPAVPSTTEPTTGRALNILDVPSSRTSTTSSKRGSTRQSVGIPKGRSLSPSKIVHPKPSKPYASRHVREADYSHSPELDDLTEQLEQASLYNYRNVSPPSSLSSGSSLSSRSRGDSSSGYSSPSSLSSLSDAQECKCNRYGITRRGDRVKLDCGGSKCGYSDSSSECESDSEPEERPVIREIRPRVSAGGARRSSRR